MTRYGKRFEDARQALLRSSSRPLELAMQESASLTTNHGHAALHRPVGATREYQGDPSSRLPAFFFVASSPTHFGGS